MESRFGHDFGGVRVHADADAAESARDLNAVAYTIGRDVVFDAGRHAPQTGAGQELLAHELAHVVQQDRGGPSNPPAGSLEEGAHRAARSFGAGGGSIQVQGSSGPVVSRTPQNEELPRALTEIADKPDELPSWLQEILDETKKWAGISVEERMTKQVMEELPVGTAEPPAGSPPTTTTGGASPPAPASATPPSTAATTSTPPATTSPTPATARPRPPTPDPGATPFNFLSEGPALNNWREAARAVLSREFGRDFATFEDAQDYLRHRLDTLARAEDRENFADRMRDRVRKQFYRTEAENPSFQYSKEELARLRRGSAPRSDLQIEHLEEVKTKTRMNKPVVGHPERAVDPDNVYFTRGSKGGTAERGTLHAEKWRTIERAVERSRTIRGGGGTTSGSTPAPGAGATSSGTAGTQVKTPSAPPPKAPKPPAKGGGTGTAGGGSPSPQPKTTTGPTPAPKTTPPPTTTTTPAPPKTTPPPTTTTSPAPKTTPPPTTTTSPAPKTTPPPATTTTTPAPKTTSPTTTRGGPSPLRTGGKTSTPRAPRGPIRTPGKLPGRLGTALKVGGVAVTAGMAAWQFKQALDDGQSPEEAAAGTLAGVAAPILARRVGIGGPVDTAVNLINLGAQVVGAPREVTDVTSLAADVMPTTVLAASANQTGRLVVNLAKGDLDAVDKQVTDMRAGKSIAPLQGLAAGTELITQLASGEDAETAFMKAGSMGEDTPIARAGAYLGMEVGTFIMKDLPEAAEFAQKDLAKLQDAVTEPIKDLASKANEGLNEVREDLKEFGDQAREELAEARDQIKDTAEALVPDALKDIELPEIDLPDIELPDVDLPSPSDLDPRKLFD